MRKELPIFALLILTSMAFQAQDLDMIGKKDLLKVNGGVSAQTVFYSAQGLPARRDPFYWVVNANLTLNFMGISAPFSASFSSQESQFAQPFNQYGISPKYKAITAHIGWRSLNYSELTMAGMQFLGAGVEVEPKDIPIYVSALYGRFTKAIDPLNIPETAGSMPAYERWGMAAKIGYKPKFGQLNLTMFRGFENPASVTYTDPSLEVTPGANLTIGVNGKVKITRTTNLKFEYAHSIYTHNLNLEPSALDDFTYADNLGSLIPANASTKESDGIILKLTQKIKSINLTLGYRRLDPTFQSMGTPFLNNDVENITTGFATPLLKGLVNISANGGFQRDNLNQLKKDRMTRLVANANVAIKPSSWWNLNLNLGNFNSTTYKVLMLELDSLNYFQTTTNANLSNNFSFGSGSKLSSSIFSNINFQKVEDSQGKGSDVFNTILGYNGMLKEMNANFNISGNYFRNQIDTIASLGYGPTASISKQFLENKALSLAFNFTFLVSVFNGTKNNDTQNLGLRASYKVGAKHTFSAQSNLIQKTTYVAGAQSFSEIKAMINYAFRF
jgi:hypothetical protein